MKTATKLSRVFATLILALSIIHCGGEGKEGTVGVKLTVSGQEITLHVPVITSSHVTSTVTIDIEHETSEFFSHFEIERHKANNPFEFIADEMTSVFTDSALMGGTYTYRARAVYEVSGVNYFSEYSNETVEVISIISVPNDPAPSDIF